MHTTVGARLTDDGVELHLESAAGAIRAGFRAPGHHLAPSADAALAAWLLPAMVIGDPLVVDGPVSPRLAAAVPQIQAILTSWADASPSYRRLAEILVTSPPAAPDPPHPGRTASFFTGGVDSFYTALRRRQSLDALVYVHGFDVGLHDTELLERVVAQLRSAAAGLGLPLVEVHTDLRRATDPLVRWTSQHGAALAAVAHLLAPEIERAYVPATQTYAHLAPLGSHPLLDPLWSTEAVELVHDGAEASRLAKLALLAEHAVAREHLRVCWENRGGALNCGRCEKCLRTMVALEALGVLDRFPTLPPTVDPDLLARIDIPPLRVTWEASLELLRERGADPLLVRALDRRLHSDRARAEQAVRRVGRKVAAKAHAVADPGRARRAAYWVRHPRRFLRHRPAAFERRVATYFGDADALATREAAFAARVRDLTGGSDGADPDAVGPRPGAERPLVVRPVAGRVTSGFGERFGRTHFGADLAAAAGTPIRAAAAGTVVLVEDLPEYGTTTVLDHGGGLATVYAHQQRVVVGIGATVAAGDVIGRVGATGRVTGPHLHFEARLAGAPHDPIALLPRGADPEPNG